MSETENPVEPAGQVEAEGSQSEAPEWIAKELERARKDAAKYRDRARVAAEETEAKIRGELAPQIEALTAEKSAADERAVEAELRLTKFRLAVENGVPAEKIETFTKRLVGSSDEELAEDAKSLAEVFAPKPPTPEPIQEDRSQGLGSVAPNDPTIMRALFNAVGRR